MDGPDLGAVLAILPPSLKVCLSAVCQEDPPRGL
jgi:hypothetical protein